MTPAAKENDRLSLRRAVVVEGRDDVAAVEKALDALIIPTHGFGITAETWGVIDKAAEEKGLIILTDPDHAGEQIRKRISEKHPDSLHAYVAREDALDRDDIGIENARPEAIRLAVEKALERAGEQGGGSDDADAHKEWAGMSELAELGLAASEGAAVKRAKVCRELGIGFGNAGAMIKKLKRFGIDINELRETVEKIK